LPCRSGGRHCNLSLAAESPSLSAVSLYGRDKMKTRIAFLALVVLLTLTSCGDDFDAQAEEETVVAVSIGLDESITKGDREAVLAALHDDWVGFDSYPDLYVSTSLQDLGPDEFTEPFEMRWDDYEVFVSPDLAVIRGDRTHIDPTYGPLDVFGTAVFKKEDGQWKLIHGHLSYAGP
jgi:ketosteroid isomerase-like protein